MWFATLHGPNTLILHDWNNIWNFNIIISQCTYKNTTSMLKKDSNSSLAFQLFQSEPIQIFHQRHLPINPRTPFISFAYVLEQKKLFFTLKNVNICIQFGNFICVLMKFNLITCRIAPQTVVNYRWKLKFSFELEVIREKFWIL